jgi:hypothetical protein
MSHYHFIEDETGDLVELVPFCSDSCHRQWCADNNETYGGWNGCQEGSDAGEWCALCGVIVTQPSDWDACRCGWDNVDVNRFRASEDERCEHGLLIQVAMKEEIACP